MFQPGVDFPEGTRICDVQLRNGSDLLEGRRSCMIRSRGRGQLRWSGDRPSVCAGQPRTSESKEGSL